MAQSTEPALGHRPSRVFLDAQKHFLGSLSQHEQSFFKNCSSGTELIAEVSKFTEFRSRHKAWTKPLEKLKTFSERLEPYFEVINIFVQSNPEYSGPVWGSIRLILKLASNFGSFFDKLVDLLEKLGHKLPRYEEILNTSPSRITNGLRLSLQNLYVDLFEFFGAVAKVFSQKNGELKRTPIVIGQLLWKPFHVRYNNVLNRLQLHQEALGDELTLIQTRALLQSQMVQEHESSQAAKQRQRDEEYFKLLQALNTTITHAELKATNEVVDKWLNPPKSQGIFGALDDAKELRVDGTAEWIFSNLDFTAWRLNQTVADNDNYDNMLWIRGNPGTGKSVLASSVLDMLQGLELVDDEPDMIVFYFFSYRHAETRNPRTAWSLILSQLLKRLQDNHEIWDRFAFAVSESKNTTATTSELLGLLQLMAHRLPRLTLLLDGVDECDNPEGVVSALRSALSGTRTKSILFSRPNIRTLGSALKLRHIDLTRQELDADIRRYIQLCLDDFQKEDFPGSWPRDWMLVHLVDSANGMFLWARLMMDYLRQDELDADDRATAIKSLNRHETLNDMYIRILRHISNRPIADREMARQVFLWLAFPLHDLNAGELWEVICCLKMASAPPGLRDDISPSPIQAAKFHLCLTMRCGSLVEKHENEYRFVHQSVVEFFWSGIHEPKCQDPAILQFLVSPAVAHNRLAMDCLSYLVFRIPAQPLSGDMRTGLPMTKIKEHLPFAGYAAGSWPIHLRKGLEHLTETLPWTSSTVMRSLFEVLRLVLKFTSTKLAIMTWIELLYIMRLRTSSLASIEDWCSLVEPLTKENIPKEFQDLPTRLRCFHADISALHWQWGPTLTENPHYIWNDVTAFISSQFLQQTSAVTVHSMAPTEFGDSSHCSKSLATVSAESDGGGRVAVLSIWPTKRFEELWPKLTRKKFDADACHGWVARFETWDVRSGESEKLNEVCFPLGHEEIEEHIRASLTSRRVVEGRISRTQPAVSDKWSLPFPMAVGTNMKMLIVLRTVYFVESASSTVQVQGHSSWPPPQISSVRLPEIDDEFRIAKTDGHQGKTKDSSQIGLALSYSYKTSQNSQYLLRQELKCLTTIAMDPTIYALTVIAINQVGQDCHIVGQFGSIKFPREFSACSIHPNLPLALFYSRIFGGAHSILLWMFENNFSLNPGSDGLPKTKVESHDAISSPCTPPHAVEYLHFSACGTKIIVKSFGNPLPEVVSIDGDPVYQLAAQRGPLHRSAGTNTNLAGTRRLSTVSEGESLLTIPSHRMELGQAIVTGSSSSNVNISLGNSQRTIQAVQVSGETKITQNMLSLPDSWKDVDKSVHVSVEDTTAKENHVKIMLHQASKPWYNPMETPEQHFPMMIHKNTAAILRPQHATLSAGRKRNAEAMLDLKTKELDNTIRANQDRRFLQE